MEKKKGIEVKLKKHEGVERGLKRLKKKLEAEGWQTEMRKRKWYQKPSEIRNEDNKRKARLKKKGK